MATVAVTVSVFCFLLASTKTLGPLGTVVTHAFDPGNGKAKGASSLLYTASAWPATVHSETLSQQKERPKW